MTPQSKHVYVMSRFTREVPRDLTRPDCLTVFCSRSPDFNPIIFRLLVSDANAADPSLPLTVTPSLRILDTSFLPVDRKPNVKS